MPSMLTNGNVQGLVSKAVSVPATLEGSGWLARWSAIKALRPREVMGSTVWVPPKRPETRKSGSGTKKEELTFFPARSRSYKTFFSVDFYAKQKLTIHISHVNNCGLPNWSDSSVELHFTLNNLYRIASKLIRISIFSSHWNRLATLALRLNLMLGWAEMSQAMSGFEPIRLFFRKFKEFGPL